MEKPKIDVKKLEIAIILIVLGVSIRVALAPYPNIEPILVLSMMAGMILGGWYALFIPLLMMVLSDWAIYALEYGDVLGWNVIIGLCFFTWTGMVLAGVAGKAVKPRFLFRMKGVAVFTGVALVMTLVYDLWTIPGYILVMKAPLWVALTGQVTFTIYHILSTLIFAPLFGTIYIYIHEYGMPNLLPWKRSAKVPDEEK